MRTLTKSQKINIRLASVLGHDFISLPKIFLIRIIFLLDKKAKQENRTKKAKISNEAIKKEYKFSLIRPRICEYQRFRQ